MSGTEYGTLILDILGGIGVLLVGIGIFVGSLTLARELSKFRATLDEVTRQIDEIRVPVTNTLAQVDKVAKSVESTVDSVSQTADLTKTAVTPTIVNLGAALNGLSAGLRRLVTGKSENSGE